VKNLPLVSIIVAVKNETNLLREAILDLLGQTYDNLEIIIVDDGSGLETKKVLQSFSDPRIKIITLDVSKGQSVARNEAFEAVQGVFVAIADADDGYEPNRIELQADYLEIHPDVDIVGSQFVVNQGRKPWEIYNDNVEIGHQFLINNPLVHSTVFFRAELLQNGYKYRPAYNTAEDYDLFARNRKNWVFHNLNQPLVEYYVRDRKPAAIEDQKAKARKVREKVLADYGKDFTKEDITLHHDFCELNPGIKYRQLLHWVDRLTGTVPKIADDYKDLRKVIYRQFWLYLRICHPECFKNQKIGVLLKSKQNAFYTLKNIVKIMIGKSL
jgi:glycosyltransferase involved in cell wall biosynthesis